MAARWGSDAIEDPAEEEGFRFRPLDQELLERAEDRVRAEECLEQLVSALGRQGIESGAGGSRSCRPRRDGTLAGS